MPNKFAIGDKVLLKGDNPRTTREISDNLRLATPRTIVSIFYDTKTQQLLGAGGVSSSQSDDTNLYVFGIGPFQSGTAREELENTTPLRVSQPNQPLPSTVAFQIHDDADKSPGRLQLTGDQRTENE